MDRIELLRAYLTVEENRALDEVVIALGGNVNRILRGPNETPAQALSGLFIWSEDRVRGRLYWAAIGERLDTVNRPAQPLEVQGEQTAGGTEAPRTTTLRYIPGPISVPGGRIDRMELLFGVLDDVEWAGLMRVWVSGVDLRREGHRDENWCQALDRLFTWSTDTEERRPEVLSGDSYWRSVQARLSSIGGRGDRGRDMPQFRRMEGIVVSRESGSVVARTAVSDSTGKIRDEIIWRKGRVFLRRS